MAVAIGGLEALAEKYIGCNEDCVLGVSWLAAAALASGGRRHWRTAILVVLLEYRVSILRVKTQGLAFIGCIWQWPYWRHCFWVNSDFLQGENPRSSIGQRQCLCIVSFLEALLWRASFVIPVLSSVVVKVLLLLVIDHRGGTFSFFHFFWLCVSLVSLDILLV